MKRGLLFVVSAPSGAGKSTIVRETLKDDENISFSVSATTRKPRLGERHGKDYFFLSEDEFKQKIKNKEFLEYEKVHDHYYGTLKSYVENCLEKGKDIILDIDVQGGSRLKKNNIKAVYIFIEPPSMEELEKRLKARNTDDADVIKTRLKNARKEMTFKDKYDYVITNDDLNEAVLEFKTIIENERKKM